MGALLILRFILLFSLYPVYAEIPDNTLTGTFTDSRDGYLYKWVKIGNQIWMAENLKATKYEDGTAIPYVKDIMAWAELTTGAYCWYNNDTITNKNTTGAYYNWFTVNTGKLCPAGWHVPSDGEWKVLSDYLTNNGYGYEGSGSDIAKSMAAKTGWKISSEAGTPGNDPASNNKSGFSGLRGEGRLNSGYFFDFGSGGGYWWSSTEYSTTKAWHGHLHSETMNFTRENYDKKGGFNIRCVKD